MENCALDRLSGHRQHRGLGRTGGGSDLEMIFDYGGPVLVPPGSRENRMTHPDV
jgi:hypothetical protein